MNQPETRENDFAKRLLFFLGGLVLALLGWLALYNGQAVLPGKPFSLKSDADRDPIAYWFTLGVYVVLMGGCFYFALKRKKK